MTMTPAINPTAIAVNEIADQLCKTIDDNFDLHVSVDSDEVEVQKLCVLTNFLLESVRRNISDLQELSESLEEKAKERTRRLDLVVSGSNDGVWIWDLKSKSIEYSKRWLEMTGLRTDQSDSSPTIWFDRVHPKDRAGLRTAIRSHLDGVNPKLNAEYRLRHENGLYRWMMCRGTTYRSDTGVPELLAGTQTDITTLRGVDHSTGLPNNTYFIEHLEDLLETKQDLFVGLVRISRLHILSETVDGAVFDTLLQQIAERLGAICPMEALLARLPGDVFAMVMPLRNGFESHSLLQVCDELHKAFSVPFQIEQAGTQKLDIAIGVTEMTSHCRLSRSELMGSAWTALRRASQNEERLCILDMDARERAHHLLRLERELNAALEKGMFETYLQPIVCMRGRSINGYEALVRLNHDELGMIMPDEFVPLAERSGIMKELGEYVLRQSVEASATFIAENPSESDVYVSVNVSPVQLASDCFADKVRRIVQEAGLNPRNLRLEVTETAIVTNMDSALANLNRLRKHGIKIALDDFGTGYSSLNYLRRLPVDVLKIDRSFVTRIDEPDSEKAIVETIVGLARLLSIDVIAEGIETEQEYAILNRMGIGCGQGYLFGRPAELVQTLDRHPRKDQLDNSVYYLKEA